MHRQCAREGGIYEGDTRLVKIVRSERGFITGLSCHLHESQEQIHSKSTRLAARVLAWVNTERHHAAARGILPVHGRTIIIMIVLVYTVEVQLVNPLAGCQV